MMLQQLKKLNNPYTVQCTVYTTINYTVFTLSTLLYALILKLHYDFTTLYNSFYFPGFRVHKQTERVA